MSSFFGRRPRLAWVVQLLLALIAAAVGWLQLERSGGSTNSSLLALAPPYLLLGILTAFAIPLVLYALSGRWHVATAAGGAVITLYALVNYYVRVLHGSALLAADIANAATAADVVGAYTIRPDATSVKLAACFLPVLVIAVVQWLLARAVRRGGNSRVTWRGRLTRWGVSAAALALLLCFGYFGPVSLMPGDTETLAYAVAFGFDTYGYTPSVVASVRLLLDPVAQPEGYSAQAAQQAAARAGSYVPAVAEAEPGDYPDVVVILNESLYEPALVTDPQADTPYLEYFHSLAEQASTGYALVPDVGGGTNRSEFELLTGNSMDLLPGITPFSTLSMEGQPSVVSYLESLGYTTLAAHPALPANYRRGTAWPALGFDTTAFSQSFSPFTPYGNRDNYVPDADAFRYFCEMYEAMPEDQPRFAYLLTIQNHGGYDRLAESDLLVHAGTDYGSLDHDMDEYLSCLALDDAALQELIEYFTDLYQETGRRVVLLMVGDHAPYMVTDIADSTLTGTDLTVRQRATPFLLWTNYPADVRVTTETAEDALPVVDLTALMPMTMEQAGLPLSPYYRYLLAMRQQCSAWTNLDGILRPDGSFAEAGTDAELEDWLTGYHLLEYNAMTAGERDETLFLPEQS